jgi:hypothetical protein
MNRIKLLKNKKRAARRSKRIRRVLWNRSMADKRKNIKNQVANSHSKYSVRIRLLLEKGIIENKDEAYIPEENDDLEELSTFFQNYMEYTSFNFPKPIFFYGSEKSLNAWAWTNNGLSVICINKFAIKFTYDLFDKHDSFISKYLNQNNINSRFDNTLKASTIMKQMVAMFLFYHELGHLVQEQNPVLDSTFIEEQYERDEFNIMDHISEYDSDLFASVRLVTHVFKVYERQKGLNSDYEKKKFLEDSCIVAITSYIIYRLNLFPDYGEFYTKESTHPHIIIRIIVLVIHFTKATIDNSRIQVSRARILNESIKFVEEFSKHLPCYDAANSFIIMGRENFDEIMKYTHELNELVINNKHTAHVKLQNMIKND